MADDLKGQRNFINYLPAFIKKNGVPRWDKVLYKVRKSGKVIRQATPTAARETLESNGTAGMFFIPLQATEDNHIKSYVACYKHDDSLYSYKLFNKDSLNNIHPVGDTAKTNLLIAFSVFGFFEHQVNNIDSVIINSPERGYIKNTSLQFNENISNTEGGEMASLSFPSPNGYSYGLTITGGFMYVSAYINGSLSQVYYNYNVQTPVSVIGTGDESTPGSGGGGGGWDWYNYGTGNYYDSNMPLDGDYWWKRTLRRGVGLIPTFNDYAVSPFNWTFSSDDGTSFTDTNPLEEPDFQFNPLDNYETTYPRFTNMVKNLKTFVKNNPKVLNALQTYSGFSKQQILDHLSFGNGPTIKVEEMEGRFGYYNKKNGINTLHVRASYIRGLENSFLNSTQEGTAFLLAVTILHEYVHLGTTQNNISEGVYDFGLGFERDAFNVIVDDDNAGEVVVKFSPYF